ncbi:MAG: hypothetical protein ACOCQH_00130 [Halanaerobiales bacterium]
MDVFRKKNGDFKAGSEYGLDYVDIDIKSWQAWSLSEDLITLISDYYQQRPGKNNQENLRAFYARAKTAIDESFLQAKKNYTGDQELLASVYLQTVKELKDWYHNGGKPREKVNLTAISIQAVSIREEVGTEIESLMADM